MFCSFLMSSRRLWIWVGPLTSTESSRTPLSSSIASSVCKSWITWNNPKIEIVKLHKSLHKYKYMNMNIKKVSTNQHPLCPLHKKGCNRINTHSALFIKRLQPNQQHPLCPLHKKSCNRINTHSALFNQFWYLTVFYL